MANRRMFAKTIIDSDIFLDMPSSTQNLYFHLNMRADDEGFVNAPRKVMRVIQANTNDLDILVAKKFVLSFQSGILVIKHWKLHNSIRKDRFTKTLYTEERQQLFEKENGSYTFTRYEKEVKQLSNTDIEYLEEEATTWQPDGNQETTDGLHRLGKVSLVESSLNLDEVNLEEKNTKKENTNNRPVYENNSSYVPPVNIEPKTKSLESLFMTSVNYWNDKRVSCEGMIRCRYTSTATIDSSKMIEIKKKFDLFTIEEIKESIDNLVKCWDRINPQFRLSTYDGLLGKLDKWTNEANPISRYPDSLIPEKSYRTEEERKYYQCLDLYNKKESPDSEDDLWIAERKQQMEDSLNV